MGDACTVEIDGTYSGTYFVPCDYVEYFTDELVNTSNTTINLYPSYRHYSGSSYDYIVCRSYTYPYYYSGYNNNKEITDITSVKFNTTATYFIQYQYIQLFVYFLICLSAFCIIFRKVH